MIYDIILLIACTIYVISIIIFLIFNDRCKKDKEQQQKEFLQNRTTEERNLIYDYESIKGHWRKRNVK